MALAGQRCVNEPKQINHIFIWIQQRLSTAAHVPNPNPNPNPSLVPLACPLLGLWASLLRHVTVGDHDKHAINGRIAGEMEMSQ